MKRIFYIILVLVIPQIVVFGYITKENESEKEIKLQNYTKKADRTDRMVADHSKFEELQQDFKRPQDVTIACLSCHTERHHEIMANNHWTWDRQEKLYGKEVMSVGKKNILNNFCVGIGSNEKMCSKCHIGYGWEDESFDFTQSENIDCLVCHDQTGHYKKGLGGYPVKNLDLNTIAQNVDKPERANCGSCHYSGGGGNNVKHGDLESALNSCSREVDVHMAIEGEDMSCTECHLTENHNITGKLYALSSENKNRVSCEQCHTEKPHNDQLLDNHTYRVACQTCHIPYYAKVNSTKMYWDWSTAGKFDENGKVYHEDDEKGNYSYFTKKGSFVWDDHVTPEYFWFNGLAGHHLITDSIISIPIQLNTLEGSYFDKGNNCETTQCSKIMPVKVHRGKQPYDIINNKLVQPKIWAANKGDSAYWMDFDWQMSITAGMNELGLPYSGEYGFIETEMYWPLNHMVSPAEQSLQCIDCHTNSENGRLANLTGFYLPGRDRYAIIDNIGILLLILTALGVTVHGGIRIFLGKNCLHDEKQ